MRRTFSLLVLVLFQLLGVGKVQSTPTFKSLAYFQLKVYHYSNSAQEASIDSFLHYQYVPYLRASKLDNIGVFKAIANDTAVDKRIYVFIPFISLKQLESFSTESTASTVTGEGSYINAAYNKPAYNRIETILLRAFPLMPPIAKSRLTSPKHERVYELRSYEGPSEKYFRNKVKMFNEGGEIPLFDRLNFNGVFYGEVVFGSKMPNLMYMTSFDNMKSREDHWNAFRVDPEWKVLSAKEEYQHNVSKNEIVFLRPMEYSDL